MKPKFKKSKPEVIEAEVYDVDAEEAKLAAVATRPPIPMDVGYTGKAAPTVTDDEEQETSRSHTRITVDDIDPNKVYGVRCNKRRAFGQATYPAMGWEIRRYHPRHFDFGAICVFLSSRFIPKDYLLLKVDGSGTSERYVALRLWTNSDPPYHAKETALKSFRLKVRPSQRPVKKPAGKIRLRIKVPSR